ncbi:TipAS antibiotic-recognition domain-containing protein [Saccharopolyspora taberi]|uniref:TipAS antibiotic-recognition domain-containing protein n=1 Tax=Saccharopolyspora taberi TaxID=60895 RepID=A0ABN3V519_9PSEU
MQPDKVYGNSGLDRAEAVEDGTALIGHMTPRTRVVDGRPVGPTPEQIGQDWNRISGRIAELFSTGVPDNDPRTQQAIHDHYRWICNFWVPDRDSYLRLAALYVSQPKFRRRIERKKPRGMAAYMRDAMTAYAWARLR